MNARVVVPLEDIQRDIRVMRREIVRRHQGPLPAPQTLGEYEQVLPGLAERIVSMAEREQAHRHELERTDLTQDYRISRAGQGLGLIALLVIAALAAYLGFLGHPGWAVAVAGIDIAAVVGVFVTGQWRSVEPVPDVPEELAEEEDPSQTIESEQRREIGQRRRAQRRDAPAESEGGDEG
ncbi:DUF2335 domain-containing protein [Streptomyces parvulus]